jgi:hypothetical protein
VVFIGSIQIVTILDAPAIAICWTKVLSRSFESGFWFGLKTLPKESLRKQAVFDLCTCYALSSSVVHTPNFPKTICRLKPPWDRLDFLMR